jgi:hypothetical protein
MALGIFSHVHTRGKRVASRRLHGGVEFLESRSLLTPNPLVDPAWSEPPPTGVPPYVIYGLEPNPNPGDPDPDPMNSDPRVDMTTPEDQAMVENLRNWSDGSASTGDLYLAAVPIDPTSAYE